MERTRIQVERPTMEAIAVIQVRGDGSLDQAGSCGSRERLDSWFIVKAELLFRGLGVDYSYLVG